MIFGSSQMDKWECNAALPRAHIGELLPPGTPELASSSKTTPERNAWKGGILQRMRQLQKEQIRQKLR